MKKKKYLEGFKLSVARAVASTPGSDFEVVAKKHSVPVSSVRRWFAKYKDIIEAERQAAPSNVSETKINVGVGPGSVTSNQYTASCVGDKECEGVKDGLADALKQCQIVAEDGYRKARSTFTAVNQRIAKIQSSVARTIKNFQKYNLRSEDLAGRVIQQLNVFSRAIGEVPIKFENVLQEKYLSLRQFSVTLFGRTMAGKSTLMEILTRGSGSSIGKGAQRTTRDIRTYLWNGLAITDVPGVAAFKGAEDEETAYRAASMADLVLFLITDDAPQNSEAECVARIMSIGKPVLGICNVKKAVDDPIDLKIFLKRQMDVFSVTRLNEIFEQFHQLSNQYLPGNRIEFIPCHLRSCFLARQKDFVSEKKQLNEASRFAHVENKIVEVIKKSGLFWRFKSFNDAVCFRLSEFTNRILKDRYEVKSFQLTIADKKLQYNIWKADFEERAINQIKAFVSFQKESFDRLIPNFSEEHYSDQNVNERWQTYVKRFDIPSKARQFQEALYEKCVSGIREFSREVDAEMRFVESLISAEQLQRKEIVDYKKMINWVGGIISSSLTVGAIFFSGPLGWGAGIAAAVTTFLSWCCDSKIDKIQRARGELEKKLYENSKLITKDLNDKLLKWFREDLLRLMDRFESNLQSAEDCFSELIDVQSQTISDFITWQKKLNGDVLKQGLGKDYKHLWSGTIKDVARIPGVATMLVINNNAGVYIDKVAIEQKIGEKVYSLVDGDKRSLVAQAFGSEQVYAKLAHDEKSFVIKVCPTTKDGEILASLSQQLTGLYISLIK